MRIPIRALWRRHRPLCIAFLITALVALIFAARFILTVFYWHNPENRAVDLKSWMTLGHVSMVYDIPAPELSEALGFLPEVDRRLTLRQIARLKGVSVPELKVQVEDALIAHQSAETDEDE